MWDTLERARRRLRRDEPRPDPDAHAERPVADLGDDLADLTLALGRPELERLIVALTDGDGCAGRPDTPARLEAALVRAIDGVAGAGRPAVTRRPAGLYTPETWQVDITGADARTRHAIDDAIRGGGTH